jgi:hypothetical protein
MTSDADGVVEKALDVMGVPPDARASIGPRQRLEIRRWLDGLDAGLRDRMLAGGDDHPDVPFGASSLRYSPGQGYVHVPYLYRVSFGANGHRDATYEVQSFRGRQKAIDLAISAHVRRGLAWDTVEVEELGPTEPGGSATAIDDRSEW